jgi:hypothetical protein
MSTANVETALDFDDDFGFRPGKVGSPLSNGVEAMLGDVIWEFGGNQGLETLFKRRCFIIHAGGCTEENQDCMANLWHLTCMMGSQMLNPKHQRYADRMKELIDEAEALSKNVKHSEVSGDILQNPVGHSAWVVKVKNILVSVFGEKSAHAEQFGSLKHTNHAYEFNRARGILVGALSDLENGFLMGQEFLIAADIFDSVLEQAKHLNSAGYKDPAAVLSRVVLEDALKRLTRENGGDDTLRASAINDSLRQAGIYPQPQWRLIQACLDVGNDAAHGNFNNYNQEDVKQRIEDIERFLATYFVS